ncbi:MAG: hypothetical protein N3D11_14690 [Candidatus Sumerlaeia bacterium]|nr:hypothetical protein [Candidatus Sumerlaeia bacterium]
MCYHPQLAAWKSPRPKKPDPASVLTVAPSAAPPADALLLGGLVVEVSQSHLLEPFAALLRAIEQLADAGGAADPAESPDKEGAAVRTVYLALDAFFRALLPSASAETREPLIYSVALLLVGEAIEAARAIRPMPLPPLSPAASHSISSSAPRRSRP